MLGEWPALPALPQFKQTNKGDLRPWRNLDNTAAQLLAAKYSQHKPVGQRWAEFVFISVYLSVILVYLFVCLFVCLSTLCVDLHFLRWVGNLNRAEDQFSSFRDVRSYDLKQFLEIHCHEVFL